MSQYNFTTINDPADPAFQGHTFTNLLGINNFGDIAGFYGSGQAGDPNKGFFLDVDGLFAPDRRWGQPEPRETFTPENFPGSAQTQMTGLNDVGVQVGYFYTTNQGVPFDNQFGFFLKNGVYTEVNDPHTPTTPQPGVLIENQLLGVNDFGIAVGFYNDAMGNSHGYTYNTNNGQFSADINAPNATSTVTAAINNLGQLAGFFTDASGTHGFVDNHGSFTTVNAPGASETELLGMNDFGVAVGFDMVNGAMHGVIFNSRTDTFTTLDDPHGIGTTTLNGINDRGDIVGFYVDAAGNTDGLLATPNFSGRLDLHAAAQGQGGLGLASPPGVPSLHHG
jgi:hypothetical protein